MGGGGFGPIEDWVTTLFSWLGLTTLKLWLSGCHVRRLQASSATLLAVEPRRLDHPAVEVVGEATMEAFGGAKATLCELLRGPAPPNMGLPGAFWKTPDWNGFGAEGTLSRRPGVREPDVYMLWERECEDAGDIIPGTHLGLVCPVEKLDDVGVSYSVGEGGRYEYEPSPGLP
jgi:hypothetical protein